MGQSGGDLGEARVLIQSVKSRFTKEPEAEEAETGLKALRALDRIRTAEADGKDASAMRADASKEFLDVVEAANKSPFLLATPAVQKKLAGLLTKAQKALEKEDWRAIVKAGQQAAKTTGRCTERDQLEAIVGKARAWAATQFDAAIDMGQSGGDLGEARVLIQSVKSRFTKEPEAEEAETGLKALRALDRIRKAEADGKDASAMRADASKEFAGARWAKMFVTKAETPAPSAEGS